MTKPYLLTLMAILALTPCTHAIIIDGANITGDFAQADAATFQDTPSNWGYQRFLASMYAKTNATDLLLGIGAELGWETMTLFFDVDPAAGSNVYPNYTGELDGEARANFAGMTFDTNFTPDLAITFTRWQDSQPDEGCHIGWHDINRMQSTSWGKYNNTPNPYVFTNEGVIYAFRAAYINQDTNWVHEWDIGFELSIPFAWLETKTNEVKIMAQINGWDGQWVANQTLPAGHNDPSLTNSWGPDRRYDLIPGLQYLTVGTPVEGAGPLQASASQSQTRLFAASSVNELQANAWDGTPPYAYHWELGDGFSTNTASFIYSYPVDGVYSTRAIVTDSNGGAVTTDLADVTVMPATPVDGLEIPADFAGGGTSVVQDTASNWGEAVVPGTGSELDRLFAVANGPELSIGVCGNMYTGLGERVLCVFIDLNADGTNVMPLVTTGNPAKLLNLAGLTFDTGFTPDKAILFSIDAWYDYWVDYYAIDRNTNTWWSDKTEWHSIFDPFQRSYFLVSNDVLGIAAFNNMNTAAAAMDASNGFECVLHHDLLYDGLPPAAQGDKVRLQAVIFNHQTGYLANQSLPGIDGASAGYGAATSVNYTDVPGRQYIEIDAPFIPEAGTGGILIAIGLAVTRRRAG